MKLPILIMLSMLMLALAPSAALSEDRDPDPGALNEVYSCADIGDDAERLACFDKTVKDLRSAQASGQVVALDRGNVERIQRQSFGFSLPDLDRIFSRSERKEPVVDRVEASVERIVGSENGPVSFNLSNGQVWDQVDSERVRNVRVGDVVTVRRAAFGSFMMVSPRGGTGIRVRRIR